MDQVFAPNGTIAARSMGSGEPVIFVHGAIIADAFAPLLADPALGDRYRLISYHRRGFGGSVHPGAGSIAEDAADALAVLEHYGVERAHVVGHSFGGAIALELAKDGNPAVHSLAVLEPPLLQVRDAAAILEALGLVGAQYESGDKAGSVRSFLTAVLNPGWEPVVQKTLPEGWFAQALADADTCFQADVPALGDWAFNDVDARTVTAPVLCMAGSETATPFGQAVDLAAGWWSDAEKVTIPGASHTLQMANPEAVASSLAAFFARHPLQAAGA